MSIPFALVDDATFRDCVKHSPISSKCLETRMRAAVGLVESTLREELKDQPFILMFDGLTDSSKNSLGVFAVTPKGTRFLAISTFVDEGSMTADEHIRFLDWSWSSLTAVVSR